MPRNHSRINQTALSLLQSWRGNCDVQILIYDSNPDEPNLAEISKVTDYVVAYSCKGNATLREEMETNKRLILGMEETTCDTSELKRVCKHVMNKAASSRLISKAEASVLLGNLPLSICSEYIENVSISNSSKLCVNLSAKPKPGFVEQYQRRSSEQEGLSMHSYYVWSRAQGGKRPSIPHFVGVSGNPVFPVSQGYAQHVLVVYKPWREYPNSPQWKHEFDRFIKSPICPRSCLLTYKRVLMRHIEGTTFVEPVAHTPDHSSNPISKEDEEALLLLGLGGKGASIASAFDKLGIHKGLEFNWGQPPKVNTCLGRLLDNQTERWNFRCHAKIPGTHF